MEEKLKEALEQLLKKLSNDADVLILAHHKGSCCAIMHGDSKYVASAMFSCMHIDTEAQLSKDLFNVVKLNAQNILGNETEYSNELMASMLNAMPDDDDDEEVEEAEYEYVN